MTPSFLLFFCLPLSFLLSPCLSSSPLSSSPTRSLSSGGYKIKGMFVFGSSLVDNGNNNFLKKSIAKADYLPYGIDFPYGPTGRFTNGKNFVDLIGEHLNLPNFIPPFNDPSTKGPKILHGVNFASGASGILDDTGLIAGEVVTLNQQIRNFEEVTLAELEAQLGMKSRESLPNYLFVVGTGGNDYTFNYFLRNSRNLTLEAFTLYLTTSLSQQLKKLYDSGGRKFVLMAVNPLGCYPVAKAQQPPQNGCVQQLNRAALLFNAHLKSMVDFLRPHMPGSTLVYVNSYKIISDIISDPRSKGFTNTNGTCCEVPSREQGGNGVSCKRGGQVCQDRKLYVFFDGVHPTEAVNVQIANKAFASYLKNEVYPINIKQLAQL